MLMGFDDNLGYHWWFSMTEEEEMHLCHDYTLRWCHVALLGPPSPLGGLTSPHMWHLWWLICIFIICRGYLRGQPHLNHGLFLISLHLVDKALGLTSYKESSARIYFHHCTPHSCGVTLSKKFTIPLLLALFSHVLLLEKVLCGCFALLDDDFMQLMFWWSCYLEEVIFCKLLSLVNAKGVDLLFCCKFPCLVETLRRRHKCFFRS